MDSLEYTTYYQVLNNKDYGTPQSRERIFAVSIRKDIDTGYEFPKPKPLARVLQDILDENVDEKYYVKQKLADKIINSLKEKSVSNTVRAGGEAHSIDTLGTWCSQGVIVSKCCTQLNKTTNIAPTIMARDYKGFGNQNMLAIVEIKK